MLFTNPTPHVIKLDALGIDPVHPGKDVEIPLAFAAPYRMDNGQRGKSTLEQVAPQLLPKHVEDREEWSKVPAPTAPVSRIVSVAPRQVVEAPGVKALREAREREIAAKTALASPQSAATTPTVAQQG